jgi:pentapeptide MXKDX repeat protein
MMKILAAPLFALMLAGVGGGIAHAADAMQSDQGAMAADSKDECMKKAAMETDAMKMKQMQEECAKMDSMSGGGMQSDSMSNDAMSGGAMKSDDAMKPQK